MKLPKGTLTDDVTELKRYALELERERDEAAAAAQAEEYGRTVQERERWDYLLRMAEAERDEAKQRAEDCCRAGERACAELVRERDEARAEVERLRRGDSGVAERETIGKPGGR
jgi:hypothetical protein